MQRQINKASMSVQKITHGMEHRLFLTILRDVLSRGPSSFGIGATARRKSWLSAQNHYYSALMLVGCFSYMEGVLGPGWIQNYGKKHRRELYALRLIRNALVHYSGNLNLLQRPRRNVNARRGRPANPREYVRRFVRDLNKGLIAKIDKKQTPKYIVINRRDTVRLEQSSFGHICALGTKIFQNAGLII